jgi:hypothetical protein
MATVPTAPNIVSLPRAQDGSIEYWWNPPTSDGGSAITGYIVSCSSPQLQTVLPNTSDSAWIKGLTNGIPYIFFITASNAVGESVPATWQPYQPGFIPSPPTGVGAVQQPASCNFVVSRSTPTTSTNTVNYWSVQATPADPGFSTIVQAEYGSNLSTFISGLDTTQTQWQMSARQLTDPGWSDPASTPYIGNNRLRSAFITNTRSAGRSLITPEGNTWYIANAMDSNVSTILYNSRGEAVQGIGPQPTLYSVLMYSSADGVTNTWISLINGFISINSTDTVNGYIDENGNSRFVINLGSTPYHRFLDKNGTTILSNSTPNGQLVPYVVKYSSNGVYNGSNDSNTWAAQISTPNTLNIGASPYGFDTSGNIFVGLQLVNNSGGISTKTTTFLDRLGNPIGSTVSIPYTVGATASTEYFFAKYAADGLAANSWNAFWSNDVPAAIIYNTNAKVNNTNEFVTAFRFRGGNSMIFDANRNPIGSALPYLSTPGAANLDTCLVKFGVTGTSNDSWRAVIRSQTINAYKDDTPLSTTIDSSNNIFVTGFSEFNTSGANLIPLDKNDTSNISVTQSTFGAYNMWVTRYNNSGTPDWVATLGGASTIGAPSTIIGALGGNSGTTQQIIKTAIDSKNNLFIVGHYNSNSLTLRNKDATVLDMISSPRSNSDIFLAKFSADGVTGALARLGSVSTVNSYPNSNWQFFIDSNDSLYLSGQYRANLFGFYPSSNTNTPSMFISSINDGNFPVNLYTAIIDNGLSTISLGRLECGFNGAFTTLFPMLLQRDSGGNCITNITVTNASQTIQGYCMGNHTSTADFVISTVNTPFANNYGALFTILTKLTSNVNTTWNALSVPGINLGPPNQTMINGDNTAPLIAGVRNGGLAVIQNDRIVTRAWCSTIQSTIIFDKNMSSIIIPQQITGSSVIASTIAIMVSYPSDGINRLQ